MTNRTGCGVWDGETKEDWPVKRIEFGIRSEAIEPLIEGYRRVLT